MSAVSDCFGLSSVEGRADVLIATSVRRCVNSASLTWLIGQRYTVGNERARVPAVGINGRSREPLVVLDPGRTLLQLGRGKWGGNGGQQKGDGRSRQIGERGEEHD